MDDASCLLLVACTALLARGAGLTKTIRSDRLSNKNVSYDLK